MYIEKRKMLVSAVLFCLFTLCTLKTVKAESVIGSYTTESLGDVLYFSTEGTEKTEVEKQAEKAVLEKDSGTDGSGAVNTALTPLGTLPATAPAIAVLRAMEEERLPESWLRRAERSQLIPG